MTFALEEIQHYPIRLDPLPFGWAVATISAIATAVEPGFPSGRHNQEGRGIPHLRPMNISRDGAVDLTDLKYVEDKPSARLVDGDVLFNNTNSPVLIGKTAVIRRPDNWAFSNHMTRIRPAPGINAAYLARQLHYLWMSGYFRHRCVNHVNQASISSGPLANTVPIVIAPLAEQERIVAVIEEQFSRLDAGIAAVERARRRVSGDLTRSLLKRVEARGGHQTTIGEVAQLSLGKMLDKKQATGLNPTPYLRNINVRWGAFHLDDLAEMDIRPEELERVLAQPGDVVVCEGGEPGRAAVWSGPGSIALQKALHRVRPTPSLRSRYLSLYLRYWALDGRLDKYFTGTTIKHIPQEKLRIVPILIPPPEVQDEVVSEIETGLSLVAAMTTALERSAARAEYLRSSILAAAFSGKLVHQDPSDEPASVLLERISDGRASSAKPTRTRKPRTQSRQKAQA